MSTRYDKQLRSAGYSDTAIRTLPHEGGLEFDARLGTGFIRGDSWGGYMSRLSEHLARKGVLYSREQLMVLLGITSDQANDPDLPFDNDYAFSDYCNERENAIRREFVEQSIDRINYLIQIVNQTIDDCSLNPKATAELLKETEGLLNNPLRLTNYNTQATAYEGLARKALRAADDYLNARAFGDSNEAELLLRKKQLQSEASEQYEILKPLQEQEALLTRTHTVLASGEKVSKLTTYVAALILQLEELRVIDQAAAEILKTAISDFLVNEVPSNNRVTVDELADTVWLTAKTMMQIRYYFFDRKAMHEAVTQGMSIIRPAFFVPTTHERPLIPK